MDIFDRVTGEYYANFITTTETTIANLSMSYVGNRLESVAVSTGRLIALTGTNFKIPFG